MAASQVGILKRLVVIDYEDHYLKLVPPPRLWKAAVRRSVWRAASAFPTSTERRYAPKR